MFKYVVSILMLIGTNCVSQEIDLATITASTAENMKTVEAYVAFKLHAHVTIEDAALSDTKFTHEVWLEVRGNKVWAQVLYKPIQGTKNAEKNEKLSAILNSDLRETFVFDGKRTITHWPVKLQVKDEVSEGFVTPLELKPLFASSWTGFLARPTSEGSKLAFSYFLTEKLVECESRFDTEAKQVVVMLAEPNDNKTPVSFALRQVALDPSTNLISQSEASGGRARAVKAWFEWTKSAEGFFPSKGKVVYGENQTVEWEIDEFTANPRNVRTRFAIEEGTLAKGTRVDVEPYGKQKRREVRYVGGEDGKREYELKYEAVRLIAETYKDN